MSYYTVIPAAVRLCSDLTDGAKLLFGDIAGLAKKTGECFASDEYLAGKSGKSEKTVTRYLDDLEGAGFIATEGRGRERTITVTLDKNVSPLDKNVERHLIYRSNTVSNIINTQDVADYFRGRGVREQDAESMAHDFTEYWRDPTNVQRSKSPPTKDSWRRHASTWLGNALRYGKVELMTNEDREKEAALDRVYALDEIEVAPGTGIYDKTQYVEVENGYRRTGGNE